MNVTDDFGIIGDSLVVNSEDGSVNFDSPLSVVFECAGCGEDIEAAVSTNKNIVCNTCLKRVAI